jgi:hypothetical protein
MTEPARKTAIHDDNELNKTLPSAPSQPAAPPHHPDLSINRASYTPSNTTHPTTTPGTIDAIQLITHTSARPFFLF